MTAEGDAISRVLITGGAGVLGEHLVRLLLANEVEVSAIYEGPAEHGDDPGVTVFFGDIRDRTLVDKALRRCDAVVHLPGLFPASDGERTSSKMVDGLNNLLERAVAAKVGKALFVSSSAVYGDEPESPITEASPLLGMSERARTLIAAESVFESFRQSMTCTIIRPRPFIGEERMGDFDLLSEWAAGGSHFPLLRGGNALLQFLDVDDLCEAIWLALIAPREKANDTFNIGADTFGTFSLDAQALLDYAGYGKRVLPLHAAPMLWLVWLLHRRRAGGSRSSQRPFSGSNSYVSIDKARTLLGYSPRYSNIDAMRRYYDRLWSTRQGA